MSDYSGGIAHLQRVYGNLDKDGSYRQTMFIWKSYFHFLVLAAVLEVCGGDSKAAAQFLQAQGNEGYDARQLQNNDGIPSDYPIRKVSTLSFSNLYTILTIRRMQSHQ